MNVRQLSAMPWIHLFPSTACNLNCAYCSQGAFRTARLSEDFLEDQSLIEWINRIPPTHIYLSGGEPLIHPGVKDFVSVAGECGHKVSLDTNISLPMRRLKDLFESWDVEYLGFVNISHHIVCGISVEYIEQRAKLLKEIGVPHFIKYVGVPEILPQIKQNVLRLRDSGTGAAVTILEGDWKGRRLPGQYTLEETISLLELVTLNTHGFQIFGGIRSRGIPCRGGQDFIAYNMIGTKEIIPCCHGSAFPKEMDDTFFGTGNRERIECPVDSCLGDLMFVCDINGLADEIDRLEALCHGEFDFVGIESVLNFTGDIVQQGIELVDPEKFAEVERLYPNSSRSLPTSSGLKAVKSLGQRLLRKLKPEPIPEQNQQQPISIPKPEGPREKTGDEISMPGPENLRGKTGDEMLLELGRFLLQWQTTQEVIEANPDLAPLLGGELNRLPPWEEPVLARALAKKVAQVRFGLPLKCNIEVSAVCPLRCEFCVLDDLSKYRRKPFMTFDDFLKIWDYMESFTTEVEFTGGEPLINKDVFDMIAETRKTGVHSTLTTNAQFLDEERVERVLEAQPVDILIAYDSSDPGKYESMRVRGSLSTLNRNIANLVKRKRELGLTSPRIITQMVVSKKNKDDVERFWQEAEGMGADAASIKPVLVWPGVGPEFERMMLENYLMPGHPMSYHEVDDDGNLVKAREPGVCPNIQQVHIGSGSEVIPCWYILKDTYVAGYATDTPFLEIWYSEGYIEYRRRMIEETVSEGCRGCIGIYNPDLWRTRDFTKESEL